MHDWDYRALARQLIADAWRQWLGAFRQAKPQPLTVVLELPAPEAPQVVVVRRFVALPLETLWARPAVEADRSRHVYPHGTGNLEDGGRWLAEVWPSTWGRYPRACREMIAGSMLAQRVDVLLALRP